MIHRILNISLIISSLTIAGFGTSYASSSAIDINLQKDSVILLNSGMRLPVSTASPSFNIDDVTIGGTQPLSVTGSIKSGKPVMYTYAPIPLSEVEVLDVKLYLQWSKKESVLRKWAEYRLIGNGGSHVMDEIILDDIDVSTTGLTLHPKQTVFLGPHSYPVFFKGFFAGIEFPIASTRIEGVHAVIAHKPGVRMQPGIWYQSRKAVYGITPIGDEWLSFRNYIESHRPEPRGTFVLYDNWLTTSNAYSEQEMLDLMHLLDQKLYRQNGISLDAFRLVCTWSNPQSIWEVDRKRFPDGLSNFQKVVEGMGGKMGLWISPASSYPFAQDAEWAAKNGYETSTVKTDTYSITNTCMAGVKYRTAFMNNLLDMTKKYDLQHIQFDGYKFDCPEVNHGHEPGELSSEAIAQGMADVFTALRKASPKIYLHGAYGGNPSPWWLFYINAFLVYYGDDCPYGQVPAPSYRESYTTARDRANLQSSYYTPAPITAHDGYGLYDHAPYPFVNDVVMSVVRGHLTNSIIVNPRYKNDQDWARIADVIKWSRKNQSLLKYTEPLLPASWQDGRRPKISASVEMPLEAYGYAHCFKNKGLIAIRNPWMTPTTYSLKLDDRIGFSLDTSGMSAVSVYPEVRLYADNLKYGDTIQIKLAPYELIILSLGMDQKTDGLPLVHDVIHNRIKVDITRKEVVRLTFNGPVPAASSNTMSLINTPSALKVSLNAAADVDAPQAELLILLSDKAAPVADPLCNIRINGKAAPVTFSDSETGFAAAGADRPEHWLFLHAPLSKGANSIEIDLTTRDDIPKVSAWILANKPGNIKKSGYPNELPQPEILQLDSANLLPDTSASDPLLETKQASRPMETIDGVYLDALESTRTEGAFVKNVNFANKPIFVCGRKFSRGICTIGPSKLTLDLKSGFKRFQAHVGLDQGMAAYDKSGVIFQVIVDGQKKWESGIVTRYDTLKDVDVDISGAKTLELTVLEGLNHDPVYRSNWSVWGEARLLKD